MGPVKFISNLFDQSTEVINGITGSAVNLAKAGSNYSMVLVEESNIAISCTNATKDIKVAIEVAKAKSELDKVAKELGVEL